MNTFIGFLIIAVVVAWFILRNRRRNQWMWTIPDNDPELLASVEQARSTLDVFWDAFREKREGDSDFQVKFPMARPNGERDHPWLALGAEDGDGVTGWVTQDLTEFYGLPMGAPMRVFVDQIEDWSFHRGGRGYGSFSTRVFVKRDPSPANRHILQELWPEPLPEADA